MKKAWAIVLALILIVTIIPFSASAEEEVPKSGSFDYCIEGESAVITGSDPIEGGEVVIPEAIDGHTVTAIDYDAFKDCTWIKSVFLPPTVEIIWDRAFMGCTGLETVTFSEGLKRLSSSSFYGCEKLTEVSLPKTIYLVDYDTFAECAALPAIKLAEGCTDFTEIDGVLYNEDFTRIECIPGGYSGEFVVPASVYLGVTNSLNGCPKITAVTVEEGNEYYSSIDGILYNKEQTAFLFCPRGRFTEPTEFVVPDGVADISGYAFYKNEYIKKVTIPGSINFIEAYVFAESSISEVVLCEGVQAVGFFAFCGCSSLEKLVFPKSLTEISQYAFPEDTSGMTIYGYLLSSAQYCAEAHNIAFVPVRSSKNVVLQRDRIEAVSDGFLLPMTEYENGVFASVKNVNGTYALPVRAIGEAFNMSVRYLGSGRVEIGCSDGTYVIVRKESAEIEKYDIQNNLLATFTADFPVFAEGSITYIPMRAVGEALGLGVAYVSSGATGHGSYVIMSTDIAVNSNADKINGLIEEAYALGL